MGEPIQLQLSDEDRDTIDAIAEDSGVSRSALLRMIVRKFLKGDRRL